MGQVAREYRAKIGSGYDVNGLNSHTLLIIKLPDSRVLRIMSRSLFIAMFILALPSLGSIMSGASVNVVQNPNDADLYGFKILPILLRDLVEEGLIKKGHKGFVLGCTGALDLEFLRDSGITLVTGELKLVEHQVFDFMFVPKFNKIELITANLKENDGLIISPLGRDPSKELRDYKIVYLRRFQNTMVAMKKMATESSARRRLLYDVTSEEKKAALKGLEDVYLEPPTKLAKKPSFISRKIKFLPDLLKDSLDEYPRRVFISDDSKALDWFQKNYPTRDQEFEIFNMDVDQIGAKANNDQETGVSTWLTKHVKREDYVVMKAEAQVVEEMLKDKTISLVDELFLECKNQWQNGGKKNGSKRAYWQCLALYGKVRDEGIAVHQWWN
ncbi:hypothetical protein ACJIZ3_001188 [Penstemon smallii]|uniref:DUF7870 domain-containing protein n=1 Tax=Penstemon smallii TaxID=265156 RepID=A0ABD3U3A7_9LAMI